jgi:ketosteroid isomerase-like protein
MARSDIDTLNATLEQGVEKSDAALAASVYAPSARILPPGADVLTGGAIQQYWQSVFDAGITSARMQTVSLEEHGEVAVEEGRYEMRIDETVVDQGKYVVVHRRQADGGWLYDLDIWNSSLPTAAPD